MSCTLYYRSSSFTAVVRAIDPRENGNRWRVYSRAEPLQRQTVGTDRLGLNIRNITSYIQVCVCICFLFLSLCNSMTSTISLYFYFIFLLCFSIWRLCAHPYSIGTSQSGMLEKGFVCLAPRIFYTCTLYKCSFLHELWARIVINFFLLPFYLFHLVDSSHMWKKYTKKCNIIK